MAIFKLPPGFPPPPEEPDEWPGRAVGPLALGPPEQVRLTGPLETWFPAVLSGSSSPYSWTARDGTGRTGTANAYELSATGTSWTGKTVRLRDTGKGWWWFEYPRQPTPCAYQACLTILHLEDNTPYAGLAVRAQTGAPPTTIASGTTDSAGKFCFTFLPNGTGYRCEVDVPTGHGSTVTMVVLGVVPYQSNACTIDVCRAVCAGRFTLTVTGSDGPVTGLTQRLPGPGTGCNPDGSYSNVTPIAGEVGLAICRCDSGAATFAGAIVGETAGGDYAWDIGVLSTCTPYPVPCALPVRVAFAAGNDRWPAGYGHDYDGCRKHLLNCGTGTWACGDGSATLDLFYVDPVIWVDLLCYEDDGCCVDAYRCAAGADGNTSDGRGLIKRTLTVTFHGGTGYTDCLNLPGDTPVDFVGVGVAGPLWESACLDDLFEVGCPRALPLTGFDTVQLPGKVQFWPCYSVSSGDPLSAVTFTTEGCATPPFCPPGVTPFPIKSPSPNPITVDAPAGPCAPTALTGHCADVTEAE